MVYKGFGGEIGVPLTKKGGEIGAGRKLLGPGSDTEKIRVHGLKKVFTTGRK